MGWPITSWLSGGQYSPALLLNGDKGAWSPLGMAVRGPGMELQRVPGSPAAPHYTLPDVLGTASGQQLRPGKETVPIAGHQRGRHSSFSVRITCWVFWDEPLWPGLSNTSLGWDANESRVQSGRTGAHGT